MTAVGCVGGDGVALAGGEERVEAPGVEQGGESDLGDLGAGDPLSGGVVVDGVGVLDGGLALAAPDLEAAARPG